MARTAFADQVPGHVGFGISPMAGVPPQGRRARRDAWGGGGGGAMLEEVAQEDGFTIWAGVGCRVLHRETGCKRSLGCLGQ